MAAGIAKRQADFQPWLLKVFAYEILIAKRKIKGGGAAARVIKDNEEALRSAFHAVMRKENAATPHELLPESEREYLRIPRYARVNTIKIAVDDAVQMLVEDGLELVSFDRIVNFGSAVPGRCEKIFARDSTLHDVILFPHNTDLHDHPMVLDSRLRLQDKASCFPAHVLASGKGKLRCALDACSAPGNKTTHLSALMGREGTVLAIELDQKRAKVLRETVRIMGANNVRVLNLDFLQIDSQQSPFCEVEGILLDPSCSGSGIVGRGHEQSGGHGPSGQHLGHRLEKLCRFQTNALCHALEFPNVRRVVYSTCSIHREENEDVVAAALERFGERFQLERILPAWTHRGQDCFPGSDACVRVGPADFAQGFFVACFVRCEVDIKRTPSAEASRGHGINSGLRAVSHRETARPLRAARRKRISAPVLWALGLTRLHLVRARFGRRRSTLVALRAVSFHTRRHGTPM